MKKSVAVVIPAYNEAQSIMELHKQIYSALSHIKLKVVFVDDGSSDLTVSKMQEAAKLHQSTHVIELQRNYGKALALQAAFDWLKQQPERFDLVATLDADLQDDPIELVKLIDKLGENYDLVVGWKQKRLDQLSKRIASRIANGIMRAMTKVQIHDMNTGIKVMHFEVMKQLNLYSDLHRYIPALVAAKGYRVGEVPVKHRARQFGKSKYGPGRMIKSAYDFLTLIALTRFSSRPMHLFGPVGFLSFGLGFITALYLTILRFMGQTIGERPLLLFAVLLIVFGVQMLSIGLLGDLFISQDHHSRYTLK